MVQYESWEVQVGQIKGQYERGELIPDPEWQRGYIWNLKDEQLLIDSILKNIPIPKFYLTEEFDSKKGVSIHYAVDGQQRLKAIYRFLTNRYQVLIDGKPYYFKDLDVKTQERITVYKLNGHYMTGYSLTDVTFLFKRLNSTGIKLTNMEIWNSEYHQTNILKMVREVYETIFGFPPKRDYRDYDDSDYEKLKSSYVACIYAEENIKRMLPLDDIIDLSNCLMKKSVEGGSKKELGSFLKASKEISDKESSVVKSMFRKVLNNIKELFSRKDLEESMFSKRTHFISFFLAIGLLIPEYYILSDPAKLKKDLLEFINNQPKKYRESVLGGIRQKTMREERVNYFKKIIKKYSIKLDTCRFFEESLRKEFWAKYAHECPICKKEIKNYDDAALDHKIPWAKGGRTERSNAQLAHKKCNSIKRDKSEEFVIV
jgi:5-methylcytosine-specific restriction endonuclease McrA